MPDYIPPGDDDYKDWHDNLFLNLPAFAALLGLDPAAVTAADGLHVTFNTALGIEKSSKLSWQGNVASKKTARTASEAAERALCQQAQLSPAMTDTIRTTLRLTVPDSNPTPIGPPTDLPVVISAKAQAALHALVEFRAQSSPHSKAKPAGVHHTEIWGKVGGPAPIDGSQCAYMGSDTTTPYSAVFQPGDEGKPVFYCLRYVNAKLEAGPWGPVFQGMVP